jgi:hypothetical protein
MKKENQLEKDIKKLKRRNGTLEARKMHFYNRLHQFCRDVDYYMDRGMTEQDAIGYVRFFYRNMKEGEKSYKRENTTK